MTRTLWMCVTRTCNFACGYCYQGSHVEVRSDLAKMMSREVLERARAWSKTWSPEGLHLIWYGGEPLTNWNLIKYGLELFEGVNHSITTNGSLLVPPVRSMLDKFNVGVLLSLDGPPRIHDRSRPFYDGRGTWSAIPIAEILEWRPDVEIAWQLDPKFFDPASGEPQVTPDALDEMMDLGFRNINFNLNWLARWSDAARWNLTWFMRHAGLKMIQRQNALNAFAPEATAAERRAVMLAGKKVGLGSNWFGKLERALSVDAKMAVPCGTGLNMLGLSPEGWLYPSQEMVYTVVEPGKAPGTELHYRVGDVNKDPVIDQKVLAVVSQIRTEQMRPPAPFNCETCVAKSASIGGCHCRYVGQDGVDPANRFDVKPGYCESMTSAMAGLLMAASITRLVRPVNWKPGSGPSTLQGFQSQRQPLRIVL